MSRGYSIALLQEPYIGSLGIVNIPFKTIQKDKNRIKNVKAAVVVIDPNLIVIDDPRFKTENTVGTLVKLGKTTIGLVSLYWEDSEPIEPYLNQLRSTIDGMNTPLIIRLQREQPVVGLQCGEQPGKIVLGPVG